MLNVDTNTLESPFNDLSNLPSDVVSLKDILRQTYIYIYIYMFSPGPLNYQELFFLLSLSEMKGLGMCTGCERNQWRFYI